jgi:ATP-dependent RNA helicase DeaD
MESTTFESLGLSPKTLEAIRKKGFEEPTPIQALTIPRLLKEGPDLIARARTGTGKTAAFGLPLVERLSEPGAGLRALVIVPTRELALQVSGEILSLRSSARPRVAPIYGGASMGEQYRRLSAGVDIVVGTPGRVLDHLNRGSLDLANLEFLILDEADEMLDMGFIEDIEAILEKCGPRRRILLFSATMPEGILRVAKKHFGEYEIVEDFSEAVATELAEQVWLEVREGDRLEALCRVIDSEEDFFGIVFTATRIEAERVSAALEERGYESEALHGEITQDRRERILARFRAHKARVLVATDVAARGIDIERLTHVVNWSLPHDPESYLHRVGRTGRAGNAGTALTFVTPDEYRKLFRFKKAAGAGLRQGKVPAVADVIKVKRDRVSARVLARAATETAPASDEIWGGLADELLAKLEPREALAAALFESFGGELDPQRYHEIVESSVDAAATARLFIGAGRSEGATPARLAALVKKLTGLPDKLIGSIEVYENFSFLTLPFEAAEKTIFEARKSGALPPVRFATPRGGREGGRPYEKRGGYEGKRSSYGEKRSYGKKRKGNDEETKPRAAKK